MTIDLSNFTSIIDENFDGPLNEFNGKSGLWTTGPRRDVLVTNSPSSVFLSESSTTSDGTPIGLNPLSVKNGVLSIGSGIIPTDKLDAVRDALVHAGQEQYVDSAKYYTGMIATDQTWGQAFGYFEIKAQIPEGRGMWPAFWLAPSGTGWPPEIDIFEAYGRGLDKATGADNKFNTAVFFDRIDANGKATQNVDITNPYNKDALGNDETPDVKGKAGGEQFVFHEKQNASDIVAGADIYNGYWVYAAKWTPENITFYFGPDHDHLIEIYKAPTPADATAPMYAIANNQVGSTFGWNPVSAVDNLTFAADNTFNIDYIKIYAMNPDTTITGKGIGATIIDNDASNKIVGTRGNDRIALADGQDMVDLKGGADTIYAERGAGNKVVTGFTGDDRIVLDGFFFDGVTDVMSRLTQVGNDVWLANGADPADPQTVVFKGVKVSDLSADNFTVRWSTTPNVWASNSVDASRLQDTDGDGIIKAEAHGSRMTDANSSHARPMTMQGGAGGDEFYTYFSDTKIVEGANGGVDTVHAFKDFILADNVENIVNDAPRGLALTGNALGNRVEGNVGNDTLAGGKGDDLLVLKGGADRVVYSAGDGYDTVIGFGKDDVVDLSGMRFASYDDLKSHLSANGEDTILDLGTGQVVTFRGTLLEQFSQSNFAFSVGAPDIGGHGVDPNYRPNVAADGAPEPVTNGSLPAKAPVPVGYPSKPMLIDGTSGADTIKATHDLGIKINGLGGNDTLVGRLGNDTLNGGDGNDILSGGGGHDVLNGGAGNDRLTGGTGNDRIDGGYGSDTMVGNIGADLFVLGSHQKGDIDRIQDFNYASGDRIDVTGLLASTAQAHDAHYFKVTQSKQTATIWIDQDGAGTHHTFEAVAQVLNTSQADVTRGLAIDGHAY